MEFSIIGYDVENDELSYNVSIYPNHGDVQTLSLNTYSYTPDDNYYGNDNFTITISDGINIVDAEILLNIISVNDPPLFETVEIQEALENIEYQQEIFVNDIDNQEEELLLSIISAPNWLDVEEFNLIGTPFKSEIVTIVTPGSEDKRRHSLSFFLFLFRYSNSSRVILGQR